MIMVFEKPAPTSHVKSANQKKTGWLISRAAMNIVLHMTERQQILSETASLMTDILFNYSNIKFI